MKITKRSFIIILVAGVFISLFSFFVFYSDLPWNKWNANKVYREYNSAVVLVHTKWSYRIKVDGKDITGDFYRLNIGIPQSIIGMYEEGEEDGHFSVKSSFYENTATAFFIREDGMLATNLHVVRPWLFGGDAEKRDKLEKDLRRFYDGKASKNDTLYRYIAKNLKVEGVLDSIWIIENGKADIVENRITCKLIECDTTLRNSLYGRVCSEWNNFASDATIFQTTNNKLPSSVKRVIPFGKYFEYRFNRIGEEIFSIGFPYGNSSVAVPWETDEELHSIINNGIITQTRDYLGFGHNISSAPGSSGSPIINREGKLVGIHSSGMSGISGVDGLNQGVSVNVLWRCLEMLDEYYNKIKNPQ